jgi:hypothetical protein
MSVRLGVPVINTPEGENDVVAPEGRVLVGITVQSWFNSIHIQTFPRLPAPPTVT